MAETAWEKAFKEYKQQNKTSVANQKGTSGQTAWEKAFSAYKQYGSDGYHAIIQQRTLLDKERQQAKNYANSLVNEANAFFKTADQDLQGSNQFNAAQYFADRQKKAEELKQKASELSQYMDDHMDSYTQEDYDFLLEYLSNFNTDVDDVLSRYQPSLDSKAGMAAYEDEFIAAMERNAQLSKLDKMVDYAFDPGSPAASFMQSFRKYQNDESYRAVTDNWTEAERYELGLLQKEDPAKAREYAIQLNNFYNAKATEQNRQQIRDQATDNIFANTGKALAASMVGAGDIFDRAAEHAARGRTTEKDYLTATDYANETTGAINAYLNDRYGTVDTTGFQELRNIGQQGLQDSGVDPAYIGGAGNSLLDLARDMVDQKGVGDIYNFGYSLAQNLASRYTLGMVGGQPLVLANYFANAATAAIDDARRRGATGNQAMGLGLIKGALEVGTEFIPTSELFKMGPAVTVKDFLKAVGVEALEEFVGEGANALGGYIADQKIMGDLSEFETAKRKYMEEYGMTEEQAHAKAIKDAVANIAFEGFSGALSGAVSGGAESAIKTGLANQYYRNVNPQPLIDAGMQTDTDSKAYQMATEMQQLVDEGQKISGNQKRILAYNTEMQQNAQAKAAQDTPTETEDISETPVQTPRVSTDGRAIQISTNEAIEALDFASLNKGKATVQLKNGETADYSDVSFASEAEANQFYSVASLPGIDTENANDLLHTIQDADAGKDVDSVVGIREAYGIGYFGMQESDLESGDAGKLTPELRKAVFDIGRQQRAADAMVKATAKPVTAKSSAGYKKVVFEGKTRKITKKQKAEIEFVDYIADNFSGNTVHVFESYKGNDGRYYYRDNNGKVHRAPNGKYVNGEIWLDLKSGDNQEGLVLNTFAHEMYHHIEKFDKAKAQELAEFVVQELGKKSVDDAVAEQIKKARKAGLGESYFERQGMTKEQARNEVYMRAMSDFVADSLETMFTRGDPAKAIANLKQENRTLFDEIKAFIDKWVSKLKEFYSDKTISKEGELVAQLEKFEQLQQLFMEGVQSAGENYRAALNEVVNQNAKAVEADAIQTDGAFVTDGDGTKFSIRSMKSDIAEGQMFEDLKTYCGWTQNQVDTLRDKLTDLVNYMIPFRDTLDLNETYGREGRRFSPYKPNSDPLYKISMDFSTLCSKRLLTQYVIENLQLRENRPMTAEEQMAIRDMLNDYRKQEKGLQVACAMCYVEAARLKSPKQMSKWMSDPENYMRNYFADKDPDFAAYINGKQEDFKESRGYARKTPKKDMSSKDVAALNKIRPKLRSEYQPSSGEIAIIERAKSLPNSTYLTAANLANLSESDPTIYAAYTAFVRTATRSKSLETDEPYYYGDSKRDNGKGIVVSDSFIEEVNQENGMSFSSWSDWRIQHMLDYITAVIDNSVRGAAMHGYTKFPEEVRVLGKTGMMFNMSGVAGTQTGLNEDGSLSFSETESINRDEAVNLRKEFPETAGFQCIGVSDAHIIELLKSDIIDYVIPYHVSGLNKGLRSMANIQGWKDYTSTQHAAVNKNAKKPEGAEHWHEEPVFSEFFVGYDTGMSGIDAMRASANRYKQMCAERGLRPKFEQFANEPNYWKLLIDRKMINQETGKLIQQTPVTPTFDCDTIKAEVDRHVAIYDSNMEARALNHVVENWDSIPKRIRDLKKQVGKKTVKKSLDDLSNQTLAAQTEEGMNSLRNEKSGKKESGKPYKMEQKDLIQKMQTEQRLIREELTGKKSDISIMEKEFIRLAKQYERLDTKTGKKSAKDARAITQLRTALKEEAKSHREDSKIWEREFNRLLRDYDTAGRQIDRLEATIQRQRATAKARVEGRRNTEMRQKIQRKVNELDQLLRHGSKHRNVPEFLQRSVAEVLNAINMEVRDGDQRRKTYEANLARYDRQIAAATDPATVSRLIEKRNEYAAKGDQFANRMDTLKKAYDQIRKENTGLELDEGIAEHLNSLFETVGNTPLGQMTAAQLDAVNDILNVTMATVRNANDMLAEARTAGVVETSKSAIMEIKRTGETKKKKTRFRKGLEQFGWNNLKPEYAIEVIGSKTLKARYDALRKGEDTLAVDLNEAKKFVQEQWKKNGGKDWDMDQKFTFTSTSGKSFELNLDQIMNLYALAKDKDAQSHLRVGGFAFDNNYQTEENINLGPVKIPVKMESTDASAYNLSDEILGEIISKLSPEQRAFADAMQAYLSDTMAAKGNEVSLKKYGIRLFKKKDYFPIRVADQFMAKAREQQAGDRKLKDAGFTKDRKPEAKNPVVISGFMKTWAEHVDEMSLYHSFVLPLDDFNRVLNYHDAFVEGEQAHSVVEAITNAFGEGAVKYLDQLIKDVNGGIKGGSTVSFANRMMSKAKKAQTMASLSVAIQQPSSILRSMSEVDLKYFLGPKVTEKTHDRTWEEIKAHAPIAIIKEMGGYDTNVGKSTVDYLTDTAEYNGFGEKFKAMFTDEKFRDDALGRIPAWADEIVWGAIWNAVKREQSDLHPGMDVKGDVFMKMVAKRFTEVITRTQVYDSVFSRSGLMRDRKSDLAKMTTSFMAEPTTTANMLAVSILQAKRGDIPKKQAVKTTASIVASLALNAALVSVVYAMRDDDEDKRYDEKWIENFYSNFFESLNPIGYIPYFRDIYNLFVKGYDVERADMELYGDLQNAIDGLDNDDLTAWEKTENVIGAIGNLVGVPLKNILRDSRGVAKTIAIALDEESKDRSTKTGKYMARRGMDLSDGEEMILAIQRGDEEHIQRVFGRFETQQKAESALQSAIGEQYKNDKLTAEEAEELLNTAFVREDEHEVYWIMDKWNYAIENGNSDGYDKYGKLYEAIESGEYEAEIDRLLEHGVAASDIRSGITKKYHKVYLEGDEATRKEIKDEILPVYEAAGMDAEEIGNKFRDWDFEAKFGMTYSEMKAEYRNGDVTQNEMRNAMKFYGLKNFEIEENMRSLNEEIKFVNKYDMTLTEMKESYDDGNVTRNQMTTALVFSGMTQTEAREWVDERDIENRLGIDYAKLDDAYKHGDISRTTLRNAIIEHGETPEKADETMMGYDWLKKNVKKYPDLTISDGKKFAVRIHSDYAPDETLEDYGVSIDAYIEYQRLRPECEGVDANGDGKTDDGTLRDSIFQMIDSLPINSEAKDGLALMSYNSKSIRKNAPWH